MSNEATQQQTPPPVSSARVLTQDDLSGSKSIPPRRLSPINAQKTTNNTPQYPTTVDIPMQEIRRQNDVDRWRNKLRLQEKFEVNVKTDSIQTK